MPYQVIQNQPFPETTSRSMGLEGLLLGSIMKKKQQKQDALLRDAVKREMGIDIPEGVDAAKLLETILGEKAKGGIETQKLKEVLGIGQPNILPTSKEMGVPSLEQVVPPGSLTETVGGQVRPRLKGANIGGFNIEFPQTEAERQAELKQEGEKIKAKGIATLDVKKEQLKKDLESFLAVDSKIDRAKGGFLATRGAGLRSQWRAIAQPIDPETGKPDIKGTTARVHDAARKRLRVQLVRAAGDVGNINIVEQEAAEQLIPAFYDSVDTARLKNAYLQQVTQAIDNNDANAVKAILDQVGIGYIENQPLESYQNTPQVGGTFQGQKILNVERIE